MSELVLFPNQIFREVVEKYPDKVILWEHPRYFSDFNFHKQKLVLHRASMKAFQDRLETEGIETVYFEYDEEPQWREICQSPVFYDPVDHELRSELKQEFDDPEFRESPIFLTSMAWNRQYFEENDYFHLEYYKRQRKRLNVLVDEEGNPEGGKWSFDPENREKMPEVHSPPAIPKFESDRVGEAKEYVEENFPENPGSMEKFIWPTTHEEAREALEDFLSNRMENFGKYQDAIDSDLDYGYHSLLSSSINTGLLTPEEVVDRTLEMHEKQDYPLNSVEGFLRQIIGWREYIRALYEIENQKMREKNYFDCNNQLPQIFYEADSGIPALDDSVERVKQRAYTHHIERLMVLGNMMLLLEIDPDEVYRWFMEMFIDSYDWVMVPNIYGMSQYSDPRIMTKPYISSSNYIRKMSNYSGGDWEDKWDGLYWNFIEKHREKISDNRRMSMMVSTLDRLGEETLKQHRENAENFKKEISIHE